MNGLLKLELASLRARRGLTQMALARLIDITYQVMRLLNAVGIIDMSRSTLMPAPENHRLGV